MKKHGKTFGNVLNPPHPPSMWELAWRLGVARSDAAHQRFLVAKQKPTVFARVRNLFCKAASMVGGCGGFIASKVFSDFGTVFQKLAIENPKEKNTKT